MNPTEPSENESQFPARQLSQAMVQIKNVSAFLLLLGLVAYFIGFIALHFYLSNYGIVPYDFLQTNYISAGLRYLLTTVGFTALIWFIHVQIHNKGQIDRAVAWDFTAAAIFILFAAVNSAWQGALPPTPDLPSWYGYVTVALMMFGLGFGYWGHKYLYRIPRLRPAMDRGLMALIMMGLGIIIVSTRIGFKNFSFYPVFLASLAFVYDLLPSLFGRHVPQPAERDWRWRWTTTTQLMFGAIYGLLMLLFSVYLFGVYNYPNVPAHYGGGKPVLVSLVLKPENRLIVGRTMGREDWMCVMQNVAIVHENGSDIYVLPYGTEYEYKEPAVAIRKDQILVTVFQKKYLAQNYYCIE